VFISKGENKWSRHQGLFKENVRKTKKRFANFENKGLRVVYAWGRY